MELTTVHLVLLVLSYCGRGMGSHALLSDSDVVLYVHVCMYLCMRICVCQCVRACMCVSVCGNTHLLCVAYTCTYVHMYVVIGWPPVLCADPGADGRG